MSRVLVALLAFVGLTFVASPVTPALAGEPVVVTLVASTTSVAEGAAVTFHGKARHALPGTRVRLQRRVAGRWAAASTRQRVSATRGYSFRLSPPRGRQTYRVVTVARSLQRSVHSGRVSVVVHWQPSLTLAAEPVTDAGHQYVDITGTVHNGPPGQEVDVQTRFIEGPDEPSAWYTTQILSPVGATPFTVRESREQAMEYRLRLAPTSFTPEVLSTVVDDATPPFVLPLDSGLTLTKAPRGTVVRVPATQGDEVTLVAGPVTVTAPSGQVVAHTDAACGCSVVRFTAPATGDYLMRLDSSIVDSATVYASTPKVIDLQEGDTAPHVTGDFPGQQVDLRFGATQGAAFTFPELTRCCDHVGRELIDHNGDAVAPWFPRSGPQPSWAVYRADATGTYRYRFTPYDRDTIGSFSAFPGDVTVLPAVQLSASVDGPPVTAPVIATDQAVIVSVDLGAEDIENVTTTNSTGTPGDVGVAPRPLGASLVQRLPQVLLHWAPGPGTMTFSFLSPLEAAATVDGSPTQIDASAVRQRYVDVSFSGTAGQIVLFTTDAGFCCPTVTDPQGQQLSYFGGHFWELPADGDYVLHLFSSNFGNGNVSLTTVPTTDVPADGTPVTLSVDDPFQFSAARITAAPGTHLTAAVDQVSASFASDGQWDFYCASSDQCNGRDLDSTSLVVPSSGEVLGFFWGENGATGTLRLTVTPTP